MPYKDRRPAPGPDGFVQLSHKNPGRRLSNMIPVSYPAVPLHTMDQQKPGEWRDLKGNIEERAVMLAQYIIENRTTVRAAAKRFGISKSTVHKDITERLSTFNRTLYLQAKEVLEENKAERHIRGGMATREKYLNQHS